MSLYSGGEVKTIILDPVNHINNNRTEFRLDTHDVYTNDMRLTNIGVSESTAGNKYGLLAGSYGVIKNISLMDGQTLLSQTKSANLWLGWRNLVQSNSVNECISSVVSNNDLGFAITSEGEAGDKRTDRYTKVADYKGWLNLKTVLPILGAVSSLHTKLMPNLKIVIEYDDTKQHIVRNTAHNFTTHRPTLCVDVVQNDGVANALMSNMPPSSVWTEIEHDELIVPAIAVSGTATHITQNSSHKVNGFDNKTLNRVLISKSNASSTHNVSGGDVIGYGGMGSLAQDRMKTNYIVNGSNLLTGKGVEGEAQRLALLCDTWGNVNISPNSHIFGGQGGDNLYKDGANRKGQLSYDGCFVGERINDFKVNIERQGVNNGGTQLQQNNQLKVHIWGEVSKSLNVKNGMYNVSYL
tara:strand:+ start:1094 stop:2323 length:1230 start_codon:yes stop_codon:yes gene_type:complete